ncbi:MAG: hypothetical protein IT578_04815 [Verrucomicrobiae bacterium]|nr:hypothetical protein [Verrucomicrobiae bacterium]
MKRLPANRSRGRIVPSFLVALGVALGLAALVAGWVVRHHAGRPFSKLWEIHSYSTNVAVVAYESPKGGATVLWVSGADGLVNPWGQVWDVYSFTNSVVASVYDSTDGGATIVWLSGADDLPHAATNAPPRVKSAPRAHTKPPLRKTRK